MVEAATVSFLFTASLLLESWSVSRARRAVEVLLDLSPPTARLKEGDSSREVFSEEVPVGSHIIVKPSERIPIDGEVIRGSSAVNQAPITGESVPVFKLQGDVVFAGAINGDGPLEIQTTKLADNTTLAHIIWMVGEDNVRILSVRDDSTQVQWVKVPPQFRWHELCSYPNGDLLRGNR